MLLLIKLDDFFSSYFPNHPNIPLSPFHTSQYLPSISNRCVCVCLWSISLVVLTLTRKNQQLVTHFSHPSDDHPMPQGVGKERGENVKRVWDKVVVTHLLIHLPSCCRCCCRFCSYCAVVCVSGNVCNFPPHTTASSFNIIRPVVAPREWDRRHIAHFHPFLAGSN